MIRSLRPVYYFANNVNNYAFAVYITKIRDLQHVFGNHCYKFHFAKIAFSVDRETAAIPWEDIKESNCNRRRNLHFDMQGKLHQVLTLRIYYFLSKMKARYTNTSAVPLGNVILIAPLTSIPVYLHKKRPRTWETKCGTMY